MNTLQGVFLQRLETKLTSVNHHDGMTHKKKYLPALHMTTSDTGRVLVHDNVAKGLPCIADLWFNFHSTGVVVEFTGHCVNPKTIRRAEAFKGNWISSVIDDFFKVVEENAGKAQT